MSELGTSALDAVLTGSATPSQRQEVSDRCARVAQGAKSPALLMMANQLMAFPLGAALMAVFAIYMLIAY